MSIFPKSIYPRSVLTRCISDVQSCAAVIRILKEQNHINHRLAVPNDIWELLHQEMRSKGLEHIDGVMIFKEQDTY